MEKEIILVDAAGKEQVTLVDKYLLRFDSGANISLDFNDKWEPSGIVCRAWYGDKEWEPSIEGSCHLILNPSSGNCVWLKPLVLAGTSLVDVKIKTIATSLPQVYSVADVQEQLLSKSIEQIIVKDKSAGIVFQIQLPQADISPIFQESLNIFLEQYALVCEPKGSNLWVFKAIVK